MACQPRARSREVSVHLRQIRIHQFACWQDVRLEAISSGVNVVHLASGGKVADFADFLSSQLFGDADARHREWSGEVAVSGIASEPHALFRLARQRSETEGEQWRLTRDDQPRRPLREATFLQRWANDAELAKLLLIQSTPNASIGQRWRKLLRHETFVAELTRSRREPHPSLEQWAAGAESPESIDSQTDRQLERLVRERTQLTRELQRLHDEWHRSRIPAEPEVPELPDVVDEPARPSPEALAARERKLQGELRFCEEQQQFLKPTLQLSPLWQKIDQ